MSFVLFDGVLVGCRNLRFESGFEMIALYSLFEMKMSTRMAYRFITELIHICGACICQKKYCLIETLSRESARCPDSALVLRQAFKYSKAPYFKMQIFPSYNHKKICSSANKDANSQGY